MMIAKSLRIGVVFLLLSSALTLKAQQLGYGFSFKLDFYSRYSNPPDAKLSPSAGSVLLNLGLSPKVWIGSKDFSVSPEAGFMISPLALSSRDYKGLGAVAFPVMLKFHFLGLSNFNASDNFGFSLGVGRQWNRTELFGLSSDASDLGVERSFFKTWNLEADFGFGLSGFNVHAFVRYGWNNALDANSLNIGMGYDFNVPALKKYTDPDF